MILAFSVWGVLKTAAIVVAGLAFWLGVPSLIGLLGAWILDRNTDHRGRTPVWAYAICGFLWVVAVVVFIAIPTGYFAWEKEDCEERGGRMVRGYRSSYCQEPNVNEVGSVEARL